MGANPFKPMEQTCDKLSMRTAAVAAALHRLLPDGFLLISLRRLDNASGSVLMSAYHNPHKSGTLELLHGEATEILADRDQAFRARH